MAKKPKNSFTAIITRLWRRTESEAPQPARRPAQQGHRSPYQSTATAGLPQFSALSNQAPVVEQQRVSQPVKNCTCAISTAFCTVSTVYLSLSRNQKIHHSVDELKLRHHEELDNGLLELELHGHRDVHDCTPQPCLVFIFRPGLAASCSSRARASLHPRVRAATTARA